jgi:SNF2 family DNA or RNA helicase
MWVDSERGVIVDQDKTRAERAVQHIPGAQLLDYRQGYFSYPANLHSIQIARMLGLTVPPPLTNYDWPGRYTPFAAQITMANFMVAHPRSLNLSDMGTGKTLAALWGADYVMSKYPATRALVVAPLSTLYRVWADAIFQHFVGRRKCVVLHGVAEKRKKLLTEGCDFYITNFDGVGVLRHELAARTDIQIVIIDEASAYRDGTTKRHRVARTILAGRSYLWLMTGTPTPNGPTDAYGLAKLVNNAGGESFLSYRSRCMEKVGMWKWVPRPGSHEMAHRLMQPSVRFAIEDCLDLPEQLIELRDVELSEEQERAYTKLKRQLVLQLKEGAQITAVNEAVLRLKLIQIACGAIYDSEHAINLVDAAPRLAIVHEILQEWSSGKVIIFAPLTSVVALLHAELHKHYSCAVITGAVSAKDRAVIFRDFQERKDPHVLIADPGTMSHGLTLTKATCIIWYAPTDRTELYLQANKRIDRPGQSKTNVVVQLAATAIEREIYRRLERNETMQGLVLELAKGENHGDNADQGETISVMADPEISGMPAQPQSPNRSLRGGSQTLQRGHGDDRELIRR